MYATGNGIYIQKASTVHTLYAHGTALLYVSFRLDGSGLHIGNVILTENRKCTSASQHSIANHFSLLCDKPLSQ
jgi:hypothetical protein